LAKVKDFLDGIPTIWAVLLIIGAVFVAGWGGKEWYDAIFDELDSRIEKVEKRSQENEVELARSAFYALHKKVQAGEKIDRDEADEYCTKGYLIEFFILSDYPCPRSDLKIAKIGGRKKISPDRRKFYTLSYILRYRGWLTSAQQVLYCHYGYRAGRFGNLRPCPFLRIYLLWLKNQKRV